eukprot:1777706-Amphidinium_carterae.3
MHLCSTKRPWAVSLRSPINLSVDAVTIESCCTRLSLPAPVTMLKLPEEVGADADVADEELPTQQSCSFVPSGATAELFDVVSYSSSTSLLGPGIGYTSSKGVPARPVTVGWSFIVDRFCESSERASDAIERRFCLGHRCHGVHWAFANTHAPECRLASYISVEFTLSILPCHFWPKDLTIERPAIVEFAFKVHHRAQLTLDFFFIFALLSMGCWRCRIAVQ